MSSFAWSGLFELLFFELSVKIQQPVNYQYLHKVRSAVLASARKHTKPKHKETSTNVEATLFTTNKEGTNVVVTCCCVGSSAHLLVS